MQICYPTDAAFHFDRISFRCEYANHKIYSIIITSIRPSPRFFLQNVDFIAKINLRLEKEIWCENV